MANSKRKPYRSPLGDWNVKAWVRKHEIEYTAQDGGGTDLFSRQLFPLVGHSLIAERGPEFEQVLLTQAFYRFALFTSDLERRTINPMLSTIADRELPLVLERGIGSDAGIIYIDEANHAHESNRIVDVMAAATNTVPLTGYRPKVLSYLDDLCRASAPDSEWLLRLMFATVSETLISATLAKLPLDLSVHAGVRAYVGEHAKDERRHHAFFALLLERVWPQLTSAQRDFAGPNIARFMRLFLEPDHGAIQIFLEKEGFGAREVRRAIADKYPEEVVQLQVRTSARDSLSQFQRAGALDTPAVREALEREGLL